MLEPSRLSRRLGLGDAVVVGLGAMIGAGVFVAIAPAAEAAGAGLLIGLAVAAVVAYCNAASSAQLAAVHPASGGAYVYGRARLGHFWGYLAGWGFVIGKTASCAAIALTFAAYAGAGAAFRLLAVAAVVVMTWVNYLGVAKTAGMAKVIVAVVLSILAVVVFAAVVGGEPRAANLTPLDPGGVRGVLSSAGLLFFAFAGYARIATLGEEVRAPERTIPRAIPLALIVTLVVYAGVAVAALAAVGPDALAASEAPLATAVEAGRMVWAVPLVRVGAAVATLGVLLSLLAGVSRTAFSMAAEGDLPRVLDAVHAKHRVPHRAELTVGAVVVLVVLLADLRAAIGFSSFAVLVYYAIANASALRLGAGERRWPRAVPVVGLVGCLVVAFSLPWSTVVAGLVLLALGSALYLARRTGWLGAEGR